MPNNMNDDIEIGYSARLTDDKLKKDIKKVEKDLSKLTKTEITARIKVADEKRKKYYQNYEERRSSGKTNASDRAVKAEENKIKALTAELDLRKAIDEQQRREEKRLSKIGQKQAEFNTKIEAFKKVLQQETIDKAQLKTITDFAKKAPLQKQYEGVDTSSLQGLQPLIEKAQEQVELQDKLDRAAQRRIKTQEKLNELLEKEHLILDSGFANENDANLIKREAHKAQLAGGADGIDVSEFADIESQADDIIEKYRRIGEEWNALIGNQLSKSDKAKIKYAELKEHLEDLEEEFEAVKASGGNVSDALLKDAKATAKAMQQAQKDMKPSVWKRLLETFKRIGFYRLARDFFRVIINTAKEGIKSFASFDEGAKQTMSSITSSFDMIKASVGVSLLTVFETLEPIIRSVAVAMAEVANAISKATAAAKGLGEYTKINTDYMKEYGEETKSSLLSFDKFETLSGDDNNLYSKASVEEEKSEMDGLGESVVSMFTSLKELLSAVWKIIQPIFKLLKPIVELVSTLATLVVDLLQESGLLDSLKGIVEFLVNMIVPALDGIVHIVKFIIALFKGDFKTAFGELGEYFKSVGKGVANFFIGILNFVIMGFEKMVNFIVDMLNAILAPLRWVLSWFGVEWNGIPKVTFNKIQYLAEGGIVEQGSLFVAGEAGAELVHSSNGTTGVTNVEQFKQAMVEALYECSDLFDGGEGSVVLNLDGAEVARSRRFKAELNRTNSGLNLR